MHAVTMGDFWGGIEGKPITGRCRVCDKPVTVGALYCKRHVHLHVKAKRQVKALLAYRGRKLCREWWEATR